MADKQIPQLTATTVLNDTDLVIVHGGTLGAEPLKLTALDLKKVLLGRKLYCFQINQTGTSAPTVTTFLNQLGVTITWTRINTGVYRGTASSAVFTVNKVPMQNKALVDVDAPATAYKTAAVYRASDTVIEISVFNSSGTAVDGISQGYFEVPVFY